MMHGLKFEPLFAIDASADALLERHHALMRASSPEESCHVMTAEALRDEGAALIVGRNEAGEVLAIGGYLDLGGGAAELKSMHCHDRLRGLGAGRALLEALMEQARAAGIKKLLLETGSASLFEPARNLYASVGFEACAPFGAYVEDPLSVFMTCEV